MDQYQVGILGGGPGGYVCALRAAELGLSVVIVEGDRLGGTCLNRGCIPTKALVRSADLWREMGRAEEFGLSIQGREFDFGKVMMRKDQVVDNLVKGIEQLMKARKIRVIQGWGELKGPGRIDVKAGDGVESIKVDNVIIATGSVPARVPIAGSDLPGVVTSDDMLYLTNLPDSLVIVGGGVIGMEFASIYREFGVNVTVVEMLPAILGNIDEEIPKRMTPLLKKSGMEILTKTAVKSIRQQDDRLMVQVEDAKGMGRELPADRVLISVGRKPNLQGIDVEGLGLAMERGAIKVNERMETNLPGVYAIGDAVGGIMLAHVASAEGMVAAENIAGKPASMHYHAVPSAIFTYPEIAAVGKSEQELKAAGMPYQVSKFPFSANGKAMALGETIGLVKVLADQAGVIIGGAIMGPAASNLISELVVAVEKGLRAEEVAHMIHAHPTLPEAVMEAAHGVGGKPLHMA